MKKSFLLILFMLIFSFSYSQYLKGSNEKYRAGFFKKKIRQHRQMSHFDNKEKDQMLKSNGTSYRMNRKLRYKVDGDGFDMPNQGRRNKKKTK